ncbi:MAG TPA: ABC transporter substrate-binding protein [Acidimicrobiales bacterium]|nr:ABC transporter substrate-binding protein [Acidimicrobiales bacterium]
MMRRSTRAARSERGQAHFSAVQAVVVVVIVGLLAAIVLYAVTGTEDESTAPAKTVDVKAIESAEADYKAENGRYGTEQQLVDGGFLDRASSTYDIGVDVKGDFVVSCQQPNCGSPASFERIRLAAGTANGYPTPFAYQRGPGGVNMAYHFDTLLWKDALGEPTSHLVTYPPETSADGKVWRFTVRNGVKWQDGTPLTAEDVAFTFDYLKNGPGKSTQLYTNTLDRFTVTAESAKVVRFDFTDPIATFIFTVGYRTPIIPRHIWEGVTDPVNFGTAKDPERATNAAKAIMGSGPYKLRSPESYDPSTGVAQYDANPGYFLGSPYVKLLEFVTSSDSLVDLRLGNLDAASASNDEVVTDEMLAQVAGFSRLEGRGEWNRALHINMTKGYPWNEVKFRQALAYAVDRKDMVERILGGKGEPGSMGDLAPVNEWTAEGLPAYDHDEAKAKALLDEVGLIDRNGDGWRDLPDGGEFLPTINSSDRFTTDTATLIMEGLRDVGVNAVRPGSIVVEPSAAADATAKSGNYTMTLVGYAQLGGDPDQLRTRLSDKYTSIERNRAFQSTFGWNNTPNAVEFQKLADQQLVTVDPAERRQIIDRMQELVAEDVPVISLYSPTRYWFWKGGEGAFNAWYYTPGGTPHGPPGAESNKLVYVTGRQFGVAPKR